MDNVSIKSYKHDGSLHRTWEKGILLEESDDYLITATNRNLVVESNLSSWRSREPSISIFAKKEWFNVLCMLRKDGVSFYCNISSPALLDNGVIKYIDYDLDAKLLPNGKVKVLDRKEFEINSKRYEYSEEIINIVTYTLAKVCDMIRARVFPFDDELVKRYYEVYKEIFKL